MAIVRKNMLSGLIGPLVFSVVRNQQRVKKNVPKGKMKQTKGTKKAAGTFGLASSFGRQLRMGYESEIKGLSDHAMALRMTNTINHILIPCRDPRKELFSFKQDSFKDLTGFNFNINSPLERSLLTLPQIQVSEDLLTVSFEERSVPATLTFPMTSYACELIVTVSLFRLAMGLKSARTHYQSFSVKKSQLVFDEMQLSFNVPNGCLCVVSIFLKYYNPVKGSTIIVNHKKFSPGAVVGAFITLGTFMPNSGYEWVSMKGLKFPESKTTL